MRGIIPLTINIKGGFEIKGRFEIKGGFDKRGIYNIGRYKYRREESKT